MIESRIQTGLPDAPLPIPFATLAPLELEPVPYDAKAPSRHGIGLHWQDTDDRIDKVIKEIREQKANDSQCPKTESGIGIYRTLTIIGIAIAASMCFTCIGNLARPENKNPDAANQKAEDNLKKLKNELEKAQADLEKEKKLRQEAEGGLRKIDQPVILKPHLPPRQAPVDKDFLDLEMRMK